MSSTLNSSTLLVGVITKDVDKHLPNVLTNIKKYISLFGDYKVVFVDGHSKDNTLNILEEWCIKEKEKRKIVKQASNNLIRPLSIEEARNTYLIHFSSYFNKDTYLLVLDADEVNSKDTSIENFQYLFNKDILDKWDGVFVNRKDYYDIYALRTNEYNINCWKYIRQTGDRTIFNRMRDSMYNSVNSSNNLNEDFKEVISAFCGMGIYKTTNLKGIYYSSFNQGEEDCEHIYFHSKLINKGGKLYVYTKWVNT